MSRARAARPPVVLLLDLAPLALGAGLLGLATGRPLFAGLVTLALGAGFTLADYTMRQTLREPVVFSEMSELPQVFTHPHLYLPFAGPGLVLGGAAAAIAAALALLVVEPALWTARPGAAVIGVALIAAGGWLFAREPLLGAAARALRRLAPSGEPFADAAALGPFGMLLVHTIIARAERKSRQRALAAPPVLREHGEPANGPGVPIIIVQCELFFDARRLSPLIPRDLLAGFDACCASAAAVRPVRRAGLGRQHDARRICRLERGPREPARLRPVQPVLCLGAGAARIAGLAAAPGGVSHDLPAPVRSPLFPARSGDAGARLRAVSRPRDARRLAGAAVLPGSRVCRADPAHPRRRKARAPSSSRSRWAITARGWRTGPPIDPAVAGILAAAEMPDGGELLRYLDGLRRSDQMLSVLMDGLVRRGSPAVLAFYGDHLPSLSGAFRHFGFEDSSSDYAVWPGSGTPQRHDLPAHQLGRLIVDAVLGAAPSLDLGACLAVRQLASSQR